MPNIPEQPEDVTLTQEGTLKIQGYEVGYEVGCCQSALERRTQDADLKIDLQSG